MSANTPSQSHTGPRTLVLTPLLLAGADPSAAREWILAHHPEITTEGTTLRVPESSAGHTASTLARELFTADLPEAFTPWPTTGHPADEHISAAGHQAALEARHAHHQKWTSTAAAYLSNLLTAWRLATTPAAPLPSLQPRSATPAPEGTQPEESTPTD